MLRFALIATILGAVPASAAASLTATTSPTPHASLTPDELQWTKAPDALPPGAQVAVLSGNPFSTGMFVLRLCPLPLRADHLWRASGI